MAREDEIIGLLQEIRDLLQGPRTLPMAPNLVPVGREPDQCIYCLGYHGGLQCPQLTPTAR